MALSTTKIDENRGSNSISLPAELANDVWAQAVEQSAVMQLAQRVSLPGRGVSTPIITGDVTADWVAESTEKPVSTATYSLKTMTPYKLAVIECFSDEFRRDLPALYAELARRLPSALARKFDATVFNGVAPGSGFDVLTNSTTVSIDPVNNGNNTYQQLVGVVETLGADGYDLTGIAAAAQLQAALLGAVDGVGRPLFISDPAGSIAIGSVMNARVVKAKQAYKAATPAVVGFAGDWAQAKYGIVDDIDFSISDQATINDGTNQINLWQRNMFACKVECEVGFVVTDSKAFLRLTSAVHGATGATLS